MPQSMGTLVALGLIAIAWLRINSRLFRDGFSPFNVLLFSWIIPLGLRSAQLSELESEWQTGSLIAVGWVTFCLVAMCLLPACLQARPRARPANEVYASAVSVLRDPWCRWFLLGSFAIVFALYLYSEFITNPIGIPLFAALRDEPRFGSWHRWAKETRWAIITPLLLVLVPLCYLARQVARERSWRAVFTICALAYPLFGVLKLSRSDTFAATLGILVVDHFHRRFSGSGSFNWKRAATYALILVFSLGMYYAVLAVRMGGSGSSLYAEAIGFRWKGDRTTTKIAAVVYGYAAFPFENLHRFIDSGVDRVHFGVGFFRPLMSVAGQGAVADQVDARVPYPELQSAAAGSSTFLASLFAEFGWWGIALPPALYALLVNVMYVNLRNRPSLTALLLYLNFMYPWTWLYFNNAFSVLTFYINAAMTVLICALVADLRRLRASLGSTSAILVGRETQAG